MNIELTPAEAPFGANPLGYAVTFQSVNGTPISVYGPTEADAFRFFLKFKAEDDAKRREQLRGELEARRQILEMMTANAEVSRGFLAGMS